MTRLCDTYTKTLRVAHGPYQGFSYCTTRQSYARTTQGLPSVLELHTQERSLSPTSPLNVTRPCARWLGTPHSYVTKGVSAAGWESQSDAMDVTYTYNTQCYLTLVNILKQTVEQEYQQRQNGGDPTLRKPKPTRALRVYAALCQDLVASHPAPP